VQFVLKLVSLLFLPGGRCGVGAVREGGGKWWSTYCGLLVVADRKLIRVFNCFCSISRQENTGGGSMEMMGKNRRMMLDSTSSIRRWTGL